MNIFPKKVVGIDFHDESAELVELRIAKGEISLESYNRVPIPPGIIKDGEIRDEEELKKILNNLLKSANPKSMDAKDVAVIFPSSKTFTHIFKFPTNLTEDEIKKALPYEAETVIPFSIEDVYWDFLVVQKDNKSKKHASQYVLFAAITKDLADKEAHLLESMGLTPFLFGTNVESLKNALQNQIETREASLIIEFGTLSTNYLIMKDNVIHYFFSSNEGGSKLIGDLSKKLEVDRSDLFDRKEKDNFGAECQPMIKTFLENRFQRGQNIISEQQKDKNIGPIREVLLTGEFLNLPDFYKLGKIFFPNQKVSIGDPKAGMHVDAGRFLTLHKKQGGRVPYSTYFTDAIGIALSALRKGGSKAMNLLPDRLQARSSGKKMALWSAMFLIVMCAISLFLGTFLLFKHQELTYKRLNLEIEKSAIEKTIYGTRYQEIREAITEFNDEVAILSRIDNNLLSVPSLLIGIDELMPEGVELTVLKFEDETLSVELAGIAETREILLELEQNLESAEFISEVIAPISNYDEKSQISFSIELILNFIELPPYGSST